MLNTTRRRFLKTLGASVVTVGALGGCGRKPFYFIQMADTQLGMIEKSDDGNSFGAETEIVEKVISDINGMAPSPSFVVVCGDMTNLPAHERQIAEYKRLMGMLKPSIPYYNVSGNHDFSGNPDAENLSFYRETYGPDRYSFDVKGWRFVTLNSTLMKFPDGAPDEAAAQLEWTKETLSEARSMRGTVVFMHHPFFDNDVDEADGYHSITKADRRMWLDLFADEGVKAVFSGHRHTTIPEHDWRGVKLVNTNAICNSFDNRAGLRTVIAHNEDISQTFYLRDKLPEKPLEAVV